MLSEYFGTKLSSHVVTETLGVTVEFARKGLRINLASSSNGGGMGGAITTNMMQLIQQQQQPDQSSGGMMVAGGGGEPGDLQGGHLSPILL